jgi:hypothetical protein
MALSTTIAPSSQIASYTGKDTYILTYRHGMNANLIKVFHHEGGLKSAIDRGRKHCQVMNYRFIFVCPTVCDLDEEECNRTTMMDT